MTNKSGLKTKIIAIGGASASGKSTLAEQLCSLLRPFVPVFLLRQDSFFKPSNQIPIDPKTNSSNWELPSALDFEEFDQTLARIHAAQTIDELYALWRTRKLERDAQEHMREASDVAPAWLQETASDLQVDVDAIVLVDGFILFHEPHGVARHFDVSVFLHADRDTCRQRREARSGYACADGVFWTDPPGYFDEFVWPAYVQYNARVIAKLDQGSPVVNLDHDYTTVLLLDSNDHGIEGIKHNIAATLRHIFAQ